MKPRGKVEHHGAVDSNQIRLAPEPSTAEAAAFTDGS